ncbi:MAG: SurA N-terminal domain-containing protein [Deltaproteobacteria bacterium]|nr:SurA N-terminal domain-containing protein [Deltaproteobacteria bacterium]
MLEIVRKHVGWGLKALLVVIIVTFVFFFGFNQLYQPTDDATAILVGKQDITFSEYRLVYDNQVDNLRRNMKDGEIPDFLLQSLKTSTQRQLVTKSLVDQFAASIGFKVTDQELRDNILKEKDFDPVSYKNFIRSFYSRYGLSYEALLRKDLLADNFQKWVEKVEPVAEGPGTKDQGPRTKSKKQKVKEIPQNTYLPEFRVTDIFFRQFADKTKVESFIKPEDL